MSAPKQPGAEHIYLCKYWTEHSEEYSFAMIYTDKMPKLGKVYKKFKENYKKREEYNSIIDYSNGNKH